VTRHPSEDFSLSGRELAVDTDSYFHKIFELFLLAEKNSGVSLSRYFYLGGHTVSLRFASSEVCQRLTPALAHLSSAPSEGLTVCVWDDVSTGTEMPPLPWKNYAVYKPGGDFQGVFTNRGDVRGASSERILVAFNWEANSMTLFDKERNLALYWTQDVRKLPSYEISSPFRTALHWWLNRFGLQFVHSGAVGYHHGGVLLSGKGGIGKSTTSLACLASDLKYASDDYCLVTADPVPSAFSVYNSAKLHPEMMERIPSVESFLSGERYDDTDKAVLFLYPLLVKRIIRSFPICAILIPHVTDSRPTVLTKASSGEALKALALSTMSQLAYAGPASLAIMQKIVDMVPCYHLRLGSDLSLIPKVIAELLHG
jgi:hypothetical protein